MLKITETYLDGVLFIQPTVFEDYRGKYVEIYNRALYPEMEFIQDDISISSRNVLRGFHGDFKTWKLISCLYGRLYSVVINNNESHHQYHEWEHFILTGENHSQVLIPPGFGNAFLVLSDTAVFHYKQTTYYNRDTQFTLKWNEYSIPWPIDNPILSERDR